MEKTEAEKILKEKLETAEKILVGIGSEWKKKEGTEEEEVLHAAEKLKNFLDGKDYYIITSLPGEDADRLGFSAGHMAVPHSVSFTEEAWKHYTLWLSCTLNRNTVLLELGENYKDPSLIRWPFEKTIRRICSGFIRSFLRCRKSFLGNHVRWRRYRLN